MMLIQHICYFIVRKIINILPIGLFYLLRSVWNNEYALFVTENIITIIPIEFSG